MLGPVAAAVVHQIGSLLVLLSAHPHPGLRALAARLARPRAFAPVVSACRRCRPSDVLRCVLAASPGDRARRDRRWRSLAYLGFGDHDDRARPGRRGPSVRPVSSRPCSARACTSGCRRRSRRSSRPSPIGREWPASGCRLRSRPRSSRSPGTPAMACGATIRRCSSPATRTSSSWPGWSSTMSVKPPCRPCSSVWPTSTAPSSAAAEGVFREETGRTPLEAILVAARRRIRDRSGRDDCKAADGPRASGVIVNRVRVVDAHPPREVVPAYRDVSAAVSDAERSLNQARAEASRRRWSAQADAESIRDAAQDTCRPPRRPRSRREGGVPGPAGAACGSPRAHRVPPPVRCDGRDAAPAGRR